MSSRAIVPAEQRETGQHYKDYHGRLEAETPQPEKFYHIPMEFARWK